PPGEGGRVWVPVGAYGQSDHRNGRRWTPPSWRKKLQPSLFKDKVCIVPAEAEGAHCRCAAAISGLPRDRHVRNWKAEAFEGAGQRTTSRRGRQHAVLHGGEGLYETRDSRGRNQVPQVRLERAEGEGRIAIHAGEARDLSGVPHRGPGGVALDVLH